MQVTVLAVALPSCVGLAMVWIWTRRSGREQIAGAFTLGLVGGILGTIGYDLARIPFHIAGQRVFTPISTFGIWLADADSSSRFTEVIGWTYHYWNGITFGLMYALFMADRHWAWAVLWAVALETIAILSPFGRIFSLSGNYPAIGTAYLGHVAYGMPLGLIARNSNDAVRYLAGTPALFKWALVLISSAAIVGPLVSPENVERDARAASGEFRVEGLRLNPDWLRIKRGKEIRVYNPDPEAVLVRVKQNKMAIWVRGGQKENLSFPTQGIYQIYVETDQQSRSSFIIVEPVEELG